MKVQHGKLGFGFGSKSKIPNRTNMPSSIRLSTSERTLILNINYVIIKDAVEFYALTNMTSPLKRIELHPHEAN